MNFLYIPEDPPRRIKNHVPNITECHWTVLVNGWPRRHFVFLSRSLSSVGTVPWGFCDCQEEIAGTYAPERHLYLLFCPNILKLGSKIQELIFCILFARLLCASGIRDQ